MAASKAVAKTAVVDEDGNELFEWKCKNGEVIHLPSLDTMDPDLESLEMLAAPAGDNPLLASAAQIRYLIASFPGYEDQLRQLRMSELAGFQSEWAKFSGVELGE